MEPASIRYNNPGAMWGKGNKIATKWGAASTVALNDGLGQGNNIAYFPTKIQGACAQFDLWRSGYCNRTLKAAILKWSGGNWSDPYARDLVRVTGIGLDTMVTPALLASPKGLALIKEQAKWEAGKVFPLSDAEWEIAQRRVFALPAVTATSKKAAATTAVVVGAGSAVGAVAHSGVSAGPIFAILAAALVVGIIVWTLIHNHHEDSTVAQPKQEGHP